ncbi:DUF4124 domain-containing protein [Massilia glaciei]|uniref:DUF4124 domain-containing protein n=2 Tax=Massilia glaciei TaxID=1524097 RepID=A0A2U2HGK3_9BURK|nr:DUF4124 domain-containing protein [Massilia glaciei]
MGNRHFTRPNPMELSTELSSGLRLVALSAALVIAAPGAAGELFRCVEADGKVTYSNSTCSAIGNAGKESAIAYPAAPPPSARRPATVAARAGRAPMPAAPKRKAVIRLFYDPTDAPIEHPVEKVESMIRQAVSLWTSECAVYLEYAGTAPRVARGSPEAVSVFWLPALAGIRHPAHDAFLMGGYGSLHSGIALHTRKGDDRLAFVIMHEMGHVLGLRHIHEDRRSVMSYLRDESWQHDLQPTAGDYLQCNWAMKKYYGIDMVLPPEPAKRGMSDQEAVRIKYPDLPPMAK